MNKESVVTPIELSLAEQIEQMPTISSQLPYTYKGGVIDEMAVSCAKCGKEISQASMRGTFKLVAYGHALTLDGYAICYECHTITPVAVKYNDDGTALVKDRNGWKEVEWGQESLTLAGRMKTFFRQNWQQILPPVIAAIVAIAWILARR